MLAAVAVSLAVFAGCSGKSDNAAKPAGTESTGTEKAGPSGSAAPSKVETVDPSKVFARQTFKLPKKPEDTVEVGVVSLVVTGKIATLRLVFTPHLQSESATEAVSIFKILGRTGFRPYLMDFEHLKRYNVVKGTGASTLATADVDTKTVNGTSVAAFAVFAAPEDGAKTVDVHITEFWPEFKAVPVQR